MRRQEQRVFEMTELERYEYEGRFHQHILDEMIKCRDASSDSLNKQFMQWHIDRTIARREASRPPHAPENHMACEAEEGVAS